MLKSLILLICLAFFCSSALAQEKSPDESYAILQGKVTNSHGVLLPKAKIILESNIHFVQIETDEYGGYQVNLFPNIYKISIERWIGRITYKVDEPFFPKDLQSYFRPFSRGHIRLEANQKAIVNFVLTESGAAVRMLDEQFGAFLIVTHVRMPQPVEEETFWFKESEIPFDLIIHYTEREEKGNVVTYKSPNFTNSPLMFDKKSPGIVITYNLKTVYADKAKYDKKQQILEAIGNVLVEDGKEQLRYKGVKINLKKDKPEFIFEK